jgi:hypothetical protein
MAKETDRKHSKKHVKIRFHSINMFMRSGGDSFYRVWNAV